MPTRHLISACLITSVVILFSSLTIAKTLEVPVGYPTIQEAINAAIDGDTVIILPGTYVENIVFDGNDIALTSVDPEDPNVVESTIIDGGQNGSVVTFSGNETAACVLQGFTITNGLSSEGGGIFGNSTGATIEYCTITSNTGNIVNEYGNYGVGGGLSRCNGLISHCTISDNTAFQYGGGFFRCNGSILYCTISGNTLVASQYALECGGGGLYECNGPISYCTISGNTVGRNGVGGGLYDCNGPISHCIISGNKAGQEYGDGGYGGGLSRCDGTISHCTISGNSGGPYGKSGGLSGCGGLITDSKIVGNFGPGLGACDGEITYCEITDNEGTGLSGCDGLIANCLIARNHCPDYEAGGLHECKGDLIINCTIVSNTNSTGIGSGMYHCEAYTYNCIIWDNTVQGYLTTSPCWTCPAYFHYCCGEGVTNNAYLGNIGDDPLFADPNNNDYHLKSENGRWDPNLEQWVYDDVTSPCIDAGDPANDGWMEELWPHGSRINMGAYGGTAEASLSGNLIGNIADLDHNHEVGASDFVLFCEDWLANEKLLDTDLDRNGIVDFTDFSDFALQWLWVGP